MKQRMYSSLYLLIFNEGFRRIRASLYNANCFTANDKDTIIGINNFYTSVDSSNVFRTNVLLLLYIKENNRYIHNSFSLIFYEDEVNLKYISW